MWTSCFGLAWPAESEEEDEDDDDLYSDTSSDDE